MVRRGWSAIAAPAGWYQVIRGPRPPTVDWSTQPKGKGKGNGRHLQEPQAAVVRGRWRQGPLPQVRQPGVVPDRRTPDQVWAGASSKIVRSQSAIAALGEDDNVERSALDAALKKAQAQAVVPPVTEQIAQTEKFIERAKRRVTHAEEHVQWAQEWKVQCDKELADAEERLSRLRIEVELPPPVPVTTDIHRLQQQVAQLQAQLHQEQVSSTPDTDPVSKRPRKREDFMCSTTEEVMEWMHDRQVDIQTELQKENATEVARLSSLVAQAANSLQPVPISMVSQFHPTPVGSPAVSSAMIQ